MGAVTKRFLARSAAAAEKHRGPGRAHMRIFIEQLDRALHFVRSVLGSGDLDVGHADLLVWVKKCDSAARRYGQPVSRSVQTPAWSEGRSVGHRGPDDRSILRFPSRARPPTAGCSRCTGSSRPRVRPSGAIRVSADFAPGALMIE